MHGVAFVLWLMWDVLSVLHFVAFLWCFYMFAVYASCICMVSRFLCMSCKPRQAMAATFTEKFLDNTHAILHDVQPETTFLFSLLLAFPLSDDNFPES